MARPNRAPAASEKRQSWTRCRIPVDKPIPTSLGLKTKEWTHRLSFLKKSPGYGMSVCGRSSEDPEEVIFIINWKNEESLQEFMSSSGFATYLQIFFGVDELSQAPPFAFFTLAPGTLLAGEKMIVFTLSYAHPVTPEDRDLYYGGPIGWPRWTRLGLRNQTSWMREPQRLKNGRLVDIAMGVQLWPPEIEVDADTVISEDPFVRMEWDGEVDRITPLSIEEVTWLTWPSAEELKEMDDQQEREGAEYEDDDEDYSEEDDDILISKQLLSEQEHVHVRSESERLLIDPEH